MFLAPRGAQGPPPIEVTIGPGLVVDLILVVAMIYDKKTLGRVHPAYWVSGGAMLAIQILRVPLGHSAAWMTFANWMASATL